MVTRRGPFAPTGGEDLLAEAPQVRPRRGGESSRDQAQLALGYLSVASTSAAMHRGHPPRAAGTTP